MLAGQIGVRQSISELGFLIAGLFLAYLLSEYWPGLAIVVAAAMCAGAIFAVWRESRSYMKLSESARAGRQEPRRPLSQPCRRAAPRGARSWINGIPCAARGRALICAPPRAAPFV